MLELPDIIRHTVLVEKKSSHGISTTGISINCRKLQFMYLFHFANYSETSTIGGL